MARKATTWAWVTVNGVLSQGSCYLKYAYLVVSAASTDTHLYNGQNTTGRKIATLEAAVATGHEFRPPEPVYCDKGLYIEVGASVVGVFVQWEGED